MRKLIPFVIAASIGLYACQKNCDCTHNESTVRAINFSPTTIIGTFNGGEIDTINRGDTVYLQVPYNSIVQFKTNDVSMSMQANECLIDFPLF